MAGNGEWKTVRLSEVYDFSSGLSKPRAEFGFGHGFLSFKDVLDNFFVPDTLSALVNSTEKERERCSVKRGDVFLTRTSETQEDLGMSCVSLKDYEMATFNGFTKRLRPKSDTNIVPEYAAYYFRGPKFRREVTAMSSLSTRASLNNSMLDTLSIVLPPVEVQSAIGRVLKALDAKIELNRRMNETLESLARLLFKSWFVDFDPVRAKMDGRPPPGLPPATAALFPDSFEHQNGDLIPAGWSFAPLADLCDSITSGGTPRTKSAEYWGGGIPWLSSGETGNRFIIGTDKTITPLGVENSSVRFARAGATVIASAGQGKTRGQTSLLMIDTYINQSTIALTSKPEKSSDAFLFFDLGRRYEEFRRISDAHSSRGSLTTKLLAELRVVAPTQNIVAAFDQIIAPMVSQLRANLKESDTLAALRDTLLPKLLSGELRAGQVERQVEATI